MFSQEKVDTIVSHSSKCKLSSQRDSLGGSSKRETFFCNYDGFTYKLRHCFSSVDAKLIEERLFDVQDLHVFPKVLGRSTNWLVLEYVDLEEAKRNETKQFWYNLGEAVAKLESITCVNIDRGFGLETSVHTSSNYQSCIEEDMSLLYDSEYLNNSQIKKIHSTLTDVLENVSFTYGYLDLLAGNTFVEDSKIYFVDEEALLRNIKGVSLIRPVDIWRNYVPSKGITHEERELLLEGYNTYPENRNYFEEHEQALGLLYYIEKSADSIRCSGSTNNSIKQVHKRIS